MANDCSNFESSVFMAYTYKSVSIYFKYFCLVQVQGLMSTVSHALFYDVHTWGKDQVPGIVSWQIQR